jgi:hypothetical protein
MVRSKDEEKARYGGMSLKDHEAFTSVHTAKLRLYPAAHRCAAVPTHVRKPQQSIRITLTI